MSEAWDGVPLNPERDGAHWLCISRATGAMMAFQWSAPPGPDRVGAWTNISKNITTSHPLDAVRMSLTYVAPCLTPAELAAAVQAERAAAAEAMRETCAKWHDDRGLAAMPGTGGLARHQWLSECIRGLPLPDTSALSAAIKAAEARGRSEGLRNAATHLRNIALTYQKHGASDYSSACTSEADAIDCIRARIEEAKGGGAK